jgi:hypothetical protein
MPGFFDNMDMAPAGGWVNSEDWYSSALSPSGWSEGFFSPGEFSVDWVPDDYNGYQGSQYDQLQANYPDLIMSTGGGGGFGDYLSQLNNEYIQPVGKFMQSPGGSLLGALGMGGLSYLDRLSANKKATKDQKKMMAQRQAALDKMNARAMAYDAPRYYANQRAAAGPWGAGDQAFSNNSLAAMTVSDKPTTFMAGGGYASGGTSGQSDQIPAMLSDGEFVIDAETVSMLGDGNNAAGASALEQMRRNIRAQKRKAPVNKVPPKAKKPEQYMKKGK